MNVRAKVSSKGQVVIPKAIRDRLGLAEGSEVEFAESDGKVTLAPVRKVDPRFPPITMEEFLNRIPKYDGPPITDEMIRNAIDAEARRRWRDESD